jgi:transposase
MVPALLAAPLIVRQIRLEGKAVVLAAEGRANEATCPSCGTASAVVHARYRRQPADLPWRGYPVRFVLTVRRFRCANPACPRSTFAEDFGEFLPPRAQRTREATAYLRRVAYTSGGEAGARLVEGLSLKGSPDTLLRLLRRDPLPAIVVPRVLGVDDLSLRRRQTYATLLVDLETHRPIDLVEGREAEALAVWLVQHPGSEVIVRDRAEAYAEGARTGAPQARQVADRFHLVHNAGAALEELLKTRRRRLEVASAPAPAPAASDSSLGPSDGEPPKLEALLSPTKQLLAQQRAARIARWEKVRELAANGVSQRQIADDLGMSRKTVRRLIRTPMPPRNQVQHPRPGGLRSPTLQPYLTYLQDRWQAGCHNVAQLFRELVGRGYPGSRSLLQQAIYSWRPPRRRRKPPERKRSRRLSVRWLCLRAPDHLDADERAALTTLLAEDPDLSTGYDLLQRFRSLIAGRDRPALAGWLADAQSSGLAPFVALANGIVADRAAVEAALTTEWSNGPVEGHVNRVKLLKRQGFGRYKLDLLRRRVLAA